MFGPTSGTTNKPKWVPINKRWYRQLASNVRVWLTRALLSHSRALDGKVLTVVSPAVEEYAPSGMPIGSASGLTRSRVPWLIRRTYAIPMRSRRSRTTNNDISRSRDSGRVQRHDGDHPQPLTLRASPTRCARTRTASSRLSVQAPSALMSRGYRERRGRCWRALTLSSSPTPDARTPYKRSTGRAPCSPSIAGDASRSSAAGLEAPRACTLERSSSPWARWRPRPGSPRDRRHVLHPARGRGGRCSVPIATSRVHTCRRYRERLTSHAARARADAWSAVLPRDYDLRWAVSIRHERRGRSAATARRPDSLHAKGSRHCEHRR